MYQYNINNKNNDIFIYNIIYNINNKYNIYQIPLQSSPVINAATPFWMSIEVTIYTVVPCPSCFPVIENQI